MQAPLARSTRFHMRACGFASSGEAYFQLQEVPLFSTIPRAALRQLASTSEVMEFEKKKEKVVGLGDPADWLYVVTNGQLVMRGVPSREQPDSLRDVALGQYKVMGMKAVLTSPDQGGGFYPADCFTEQASDP
eukprot:6822157-Pyramimonas_sp.AAC.1